jgi:hypothetical protein
MVTWFIVIITSNRMSATQTPSDTSGRQNCDWSAGSSMDTPEVKISRQRKRASERALKKRDSKVTLTECDADSYQHRCPACNEPIHPRLKDYIPKHWAIRQYRCKSCKNWLMLDWKSRLRFHALTLPISMIYISAIMCGAVALRASPKAAIVITLLASFATSLAVRDALGRWMARRARWEQSPN